MEQFFVNILEARFFLKTPRKEEIDIIYTRNIHPIPIEIKIREKINKNDVKALFRFMEKNRIREVSAAFAYGINADCKLGGFGFALDTSKMMVARETE